MRTDPGNHERGEGICDMEAAAWNSSLKASALESQLPGTHKMEKFGTMWAKKLANFKYQPLTSSCFVLIQTVNITSTRNRRLPVFYFGYFPEALKDTEQE